MEILLFVHFRFCSRTILYSNQSLETYLAQFFQESKLKFSLVRRLDMKNVIKPLIGSITVFFAANETFVDSSSARSNSDKIGFSSVSFTVHSIVCFNPTNSLKLKSSLQFVKTFFKSRNYAEGTCLSVLNIS